MSHWNHRVLVTQYNDDLFYTIHEVHYNDKGEPAGYTERGIAVCGESIDELEATLGNMLQCLSRPALWGDDRFPEEFKAITA